MSLKHNLFVVLGAGVFGLLGLFNLAIGVYHTILFASQGSQSLFSVAYGIAVTNAQMRDPARLFGSDAIEVYSVLLGGYGLLAIGATIESLRGHRGGSG